VQSISPRSEKGFTLVELMVVIAIIAIFATIALPNYQETIERNRLKSAIQEVKGALQLARSTALKQSADIIFAPTAGANGAWSYSYGITTSATGKHPQVSFSGTDSVTFNGRRGTTGEASAVTYTLSTSNFSSTISVSPAGTISATDP